MLYVHVVIVGTSVKVIPFLPYSNPNIENYA